MTAANTELKTIAPKPRKKVAEPVAADVWAPAETVLAIRTCKADGSSFDGKFRYDLTPGSVVVAPDWNPKPVCGGGLHVLVDGQGDWNLLDWSVDAKALVVRVRKDELVEIDSAKSKVPRLRVERVTTLATALCEIACDKATISRVVERVLEEARKAGKEPASGDTAKLAASGYTAKLAASGYTAKLAASGYAAQLAASGNDSQLAASGNDSQLAASGYAALILGAYRATAKAGAGGCIALAWYDAEAGRPRVSVGYVGDGLKANTWYHVDERGVFVEAPR